MQHLEVSLTGEQWLILQLCDSVFPAGGFAHSGGLEAAWQQGRVPDNDALDELTRCQLNQVARASAPFVAEACSGVTAFAQLDCLCDATLSNHVANRASRAQGQAFLLACSRIFPQPGVARLASAIRVGGAAAHFAPVFGAVCQALGVDAETCVRMFLFLALRSFISAAVRLGIVGPLEGQSVHWRCSSHAENLVKCALSIPSDDVAQTAPLLDILQGGQDRLYSRLFQS